MRAGVHAALISLISLFAVVTYLWSDRDPPSYIMAMWTYPHELSTDEPFVITEIFFRMTSCARIIEHEFVQGDVSYPIGTIMTPYPKPLGLIKQKFSAIVPFGMSRGLAVYVATLIWKCPLNPISWAWPITKTITYPVYIKE